MPITNTIAITTTKAKINQSCLSIPIFFLPRCTVQCDLHFFLMFLLAAQRARAISSGEALTIDRDNDKNPVVALREIADQTVENDVLRDDLIAGMQKHIEVDEAEEDNMAALMGETTADLPEASSISEADLLQALRTESPIVPTAPAPTANDIFGMPSDEQS